MRIAFESSNGAARLLHGDCVDVMKSLADDSIDAIVCDPPYGLEFMGKDFDKLGSGESQERWHTAWCTEAFRVLKPGGHLLAFGGTRTFHRLACAVEDAGFEIRDSLIWCYGSGFPKSQDISKFIDKAAGAEREVVGVNEDYLRRKPNGMKTDGATSYGYSQKQYETDARITAPATDAAKKWAGWGSALKPAFEPVVVGRKPLDGTLAANTLKHGVGGLNIDASRIPFTSAADEKESKDKNQHADFGTPPMTGNTTYGDYSMVQPKNYNPPGRWPANLLLSHSPSCVHLDIADDTDLWACVLGCPVRAMDAQSGTSKSSGGAGEKSRGGMGKKVFGKYALDRNGENAGGLGDVGGASRYFMRFDPNDAPFIYCAKAATKERGEGVDGRNTHPTVKPVSVMRYLIKLVTPPSGVVLDPFMGSGTTGVAAMLENVRFIGIEREDEYIDIATQRIRHHAAPSRPTLTLTHPE